jgi:hypothetical protein
LTCPFISLYFSLIDDDGKGRVGEVGQDALPPIPRSVADIHAPVLRKTAASVTLICSRVIGNEWTRMNTNKSGDSREARPGSVLDHLAEMSFLAPGISDSCPLVFIRG